LTPARFGLFPFRSPLLRESLLLSFPRGTEMFQFPRFPLPALCVQAGVTPVEGVPGSPIRTSTDQSSVDSSPWLIAATHVLHRLQAPRHPPLALRSLENKDIDARARYGVLKGPGRHVQRSGARTLEPRESRESPDLRTAGRSDRRGRPTPSALGRAESETLPGPLPQNGTETHACSPGPGRRPKACDHRGRRAAE
jgi:hypothetical protein